MEDTLRDPSFFNKSAVEVVLILVLMEDTLRGYCKSLFLHNVKWS